MKQTMTLRTCFLGLMLLIFSWSKAQVQIQVLDQKSLLPIAAAYIANESQLVETDKQGIGIIRIQEVPFKITISHLDYKGLTTQVFSDTVLYLVPKTSYLSEVEVRGFEQLKPIMQQSAPIAFLDSKELSRFNETTLVNAVNTMPGIRMEERAPLSYRISIRGSSLRAPFGVRNVKIYWNELPFTEPNGVTPLNLLDFSNIDEMEIIKGPAGSIFGAGTGGAIQLSSGNYADLTSAYELDLMAGSFGMQRLSMRSTSVYNNAATDVRMSYQTADGYRDHSRSERKTAQFIQHLQINEQQNLRFYFLLTDISYQIPGALNEQEFSENPRLARPLSADRGSGVSQQSIYLGAVHQWKLKRGWEAKNVLFANFSQFDNPFILDYKTEESATWGIRSLVTKTHQLKKSQVNLTVGAEYSHNLTDAFNYGNVDGQPDTVRFHDFLNVAQAFAFSQAEWLFQKGWSVTAGLSLNYMRYDIDRIQDRILDTAYVFVRNFDPQWVPRVAILKSIGQQLSLHGSISSGFSPPTVSEVRTNEGSINRNLQAERGLNYEIGARWISKDKKWFADVNTFLFKLNETITTETNPEGVVLFRNAGATNQPGVELLLKGRLLSDWQWWRTIDFQAAYTGHYFTFEDYQLAGNDFSGNSLTGVAPHYTSFSLDFTFIKGFYSNFTWQYSDAIPLNDANIVFADSYHLLNWRAGYRKLISAKWEMEFFVGADNLLNETYSLGNDLNPFGGRFFQPAPGRNYYGGLKVKYIK